MRKSRREIVEKRARRDVTFLVTGATGFIGSHLAVELLNRGYRVMLLCRPNDDLTATQRVARVFRWFGIDLGQTSRLEVIEGFIDQPLFGLTKEKYDRLVRETDELFHCAADTSFAERKRTRIEATNVTSVQNVLDLATAGSCYFFHHVSTAYVAGKKSGYCEEAWVETQDFTNVYEETKHKGERAVLEACSKAGLNLNIYRPSIVYGNSETGRSTRFNALYYPVKTVLYFKDIYKLDIEENEGKNAENMGVRVNDGGSIHLPIRVEKGDGGGLNVIPIDFFLKACMAIMEESLDGDIFHIVNNEPTMLADLIDYTQTLFDINGMRAVRKEDLEVVPKNALETVVHAYLDIYSPYMRDMRIFGTEKVDAILSRKGVTCPKLDYDIFERCMRYAVQADWGNKLFENDPADSQSPL
ncbi:MAG: SDR family oxidoreductase [Chloroflexi bacterium]|nr:SDR family oxidoreductase [Chloroflexota bacterium]